MAALAQAATQATFAATKVAARPQRTRVVAVHAQAAEPLQAAPLRFLAAGLAAAALAGAAPAQAGVVLVQPEVKNFVKEGGLAVKKADAPASSGGKKAAPAKKAAAKKTPEAAPSGNGFESFRPFVFPLSILAVAGAGAAASKADPEFAELFDKTWSAKDSIGTGAGYETAPGMKDGPMFGGSGGGKAAPAKTGTMKKTVKGGAATAKKGGLGGLFGK